LSSRPGIADDLLSSARSVGVQLKGVTRSEWILLAALVAGFTPVIVSLFQLEWSRPESGHGPIVLALTLWLFSRAWRRTGADIAPSSSGWSWLWVPTMLVACVAYLFGSVGEIAQFSYGAMVPFALAVVFAFRAPAAWRHFVFPCVFLVFSIPLPGFIVDPITLPMKLLVSTLSEHILSAFGYPASRSGVMLYVGQYQLLVADACAGLRTLFTLEALGLFYLNVVEHASTLRNVGLAICIVPISIIANTLRVLVLCLITYHFGDEAGQGFLHEFAGMVLFLFGLLLLLGADGLFRFVARRVERPVVGSAA